MGFLNGQDVSPPYLRASVLATYTRGGIWSQSFLSVLPHSPQIQLGKCETLAQVMLSDSDIPKFRKVDAFGQGEGKPFDHYLRYVFIKKEIRNRYAKNIKVFN